MGMDKKTAFAPQVVIPARWVQEIFYYGRMHEWIYQIIDVGTSSVSVPVGYICLIC